MGKRGLCIILLIGLVSCCSASTIKNYTINLENEAFKIDSLNYYVENIIDGRLDTTCIGYAYLGISGSKTPLNFTKNLKQEVTGFIQKNLIKTEEGKACILRINRLFVSERQTNNNVIGEVELNVTFLEQAGDKYIEIYTGGTHVEEAAVFDITANQAANISKAFKNCFMQFKVRKHIIKNYRFISKNQISANPFSDGYMLNNLSKRKNGLYRTYIDFRDDTPDTTISYKIKDGIPVDDKGESKFLIWGFCNDGKFYVKAGRKFKPLFIEDNICFIYGRPINDGLFLFAADPVTALISLTIDAIVAIDQYSKDDIKYIFDYSTGLFWPYKDKSGVTLSNRIIIFAGDLSLKKNAKVDIEIDGKKVCSIDNDEYYVIRTPFFNNTVNVTLSCGEMKMNKTVFSNRIRFEFYDCTTNKKSISLDDVSTFTSNLILKEMDEESLTRVCN